MIVVSAEASGRMKNVGRTSTSTEHVSIKPFELMLAMDRKSGVIEYRIFNIRHSLGHSKSVLIFSSAPGE